jgi:ribosomal protein S18 acetylase RimI-like enzyme
MTALSFRKATVDDLAVIITMLADDELGRSRENAELPLDLAYLNAFHAISADPHQHFILAECEGEIMGFFQLSFIPGLSRRGAWRGNIESVRIAKSQRNKGLGEAMMRHAIALCRTKGCATVQLTSDKQRTAAHRFYGRLGFVASHEGFKLSLRMGD